jgi:hypothetical protein
MAIQYPTQWYHSRANLIWPNGPLKYIFPKIQNYRAAVPYKEGKLKAIRPGSYT